jgi:alginate O-acetyltransferase complex protein AlgI
MLFTSVNFVLFVAVVLLMYYIVPKKWQWIMLLCANVCFYLQAGIRGAVFMLATIISTYICGRMIAKAGERQKLAMDKLKEIMSKEQKKAYKAKTKRVQKFWMTGCLLFNFGILAVLKYTNFFISFTSLKPVDFILPMGISFYTFQSMGYIIDVYRGVAEAEKNIFRFALFVSFFPQLMQGPISRWKDLKETLFCPHTFSWAQFERGLQRVLWGYFKKMVIADRAAIGLATLTGDFSKYTGAYAFLGMLIYAVELYADFTGGIDITIGVAEMFGIRLPENFRQPFFSRSLAEYWRRWHITLCAWFKDYVFYPISMAKWMNKSSKWLKKHISGALGQRFPIYTATLTVWFVTGFWHGASWNFIVWGLLNGIIMLISQELEPVYAKVDGKLGLKKRKAYQGFEIVRTTAIVCALQMLDYHANIADAFRQFISMFTTANYGSVFSNGMFHIGLSAADYCVLIIGVFIMYIVSFLGREKPVRERLAQKSFALRFALFLAVFLCIAVFGVYGIGYESSQFIYNQF